MGWYQFGIALNQPLDRHESFQKDLLNGDAGLVFPHSSFSQLMSIDRQDTMSATPSPTPALPPPPGETPNFVNPETLLKWEILTICLCLISTTIVFVLRTYVRISIKRSWILEDCKHSFSLDYSTAILTLYGRYVHSFMGLYSLDLAQ